VGAGEKNWMHARKSCAAERLAQSRSDFKSSWGTSELGGGSQSLGHRRKRGLLPLWGPERGIRGPKNRAEKTGESGKIAREGKLRGPSSKGESGLLIEKYATELGRRHRPLNC